MAEKIIVKGEVTYIKYRSPGFCIGDIRLDPEFIPPGKYQVVAFKLFGEVEVAERVSLEGNWKDDPRWGLQFEAKGINFDVPEDQNGIAAYLAKCPAFRGFGPVKAQKFTRKLEEERNRFTIAEDKFLSLSDTIERLPPSWIAEAAGISEHDAALFKERWHERAAINAVSTALHAFSLTQSQVRRIVQAFGTGAIRQIKTNPYLMIGKVEGMGFKTVDQIALAAGFSKGDPKRVRAALRFVVDSLAGEGHTWTPKNDLVETAVKQLNMDELDAKARVLDALDKLTSSVKVVQAPNGAMQITVDEGEIRHALIEDPEGRVSTPEVYRVESEVLEMLGAACGAQNPHFAPGAKCPVWDEKGKEVIGERLEDGLFSFGICAALGDGLNDQQNSALGSAQNFHAMALSGGAGVGKTFVVRRILEMYMACGWRKVKLCAPTGKAAKRLEETTKFPAETIHRMLMFMGGVAPSAPSVGSMRPVPWGGFMAGMIDADVVIVDESSMIDIHLFHALISRVDFKKTSLILVGDHNQLQPVGPGNVFRDILRRSLLPRVVLTEVVRQAGALRDNACSILTGEVRPTVPGAGRLPWVVLKTTDTERVQKRVVELFGELLPNRMGYAMESIQVLSPKREGDLGVNTLNLLLQQVYQLQTQNRKIDLDLNQKRAKLYVGDRVIVTKNLYPLGVMNGDVGTVVHVEPARVEVEIPVSPHDTRKPVVEFTGEDIAEISLAYALTVHKAQGSEFPCVVLVIHSSHSFIHHSGGRNLFYTGATRARETLVIVGDQPGLSGCASHETTERRRTWLSVLEPKMIGAQL
jgi:exodeoxyribonuclease V alpha subunit